MTTLHTPESATTWPFVHDSVRQQANATPTRTAVIDDLGRRVDYAAVIERSTRLARRLTALGVRPDDRVAVFMERSTNLIVSMLAVLDAGGCYVPVDTNYPDERAAAMLEHAKPRLLIADGPFPDRLALPGLVVIPPDGMEGGDEQSAVVANVELTPQTLAYIIYTSGSTGAPKGVAMTHQGLSRLIAWQVGDGPRGLTTLQFTAICFDVTFQEILSTLGSGGTLVLVPERVRRDPDQLLETIDRALIERLFLPYTALQQLAVASQRTSRIPRTLRHVITAGEQVIVTDAIARFFSALPSCRLDNQYGPTETHLVTRYTLDGDPAQWPSLPPIGAAARGMCLYCLDTNLQPVPTGESGQLYVGGEGLARGYWNDAGLTAERFIADPFSGAPDARMYNTGDVGRIGFNGVAEFLGRSDDQIKVRGFRVEPGEIERVLASHEHVRQASVGLREIADRVPALVAYIVTDGQPISVGGLQSYVRERLPEYMVPQRVVFLNSLPLTSTGKIDRRRLGRETELPALTPVAMAPDSASLIDTVRTIWTRVLGHDEFTLDDDFFAVGGDSLLATWVVTELTLALGREIKLSLMLDDSTVRGIASSLEALSLRAPVHRSASTLVTLRAGPSNRVLYLVHTLGGEVVSYRDLARAIRSPLRVLGLTWQQSEMDDPRSLVGMAAAHVELLRSIQPVGSYLLAGWSFGGVLAYEVAQQLQAAGRTVEFLGLLDSNPIRDSTTGIPARDTPLFAPLNEVMNGIDEGREPAELLRSLAESRASTLLGDIPDGFSTTHLRKALRTTVHSMRAAMEYRAAPYAGPIDLFQPDGAPPDTQACLHTELRGLARGALRIHMVPGDHFSMLRPPLADALANAVGVALVCANSPA